MWSYADGSSVAKFIRDYVELYEGATVSWNELTAFYQEPRLSVGKIPVVEFAHHLDQFFRPHPIWDRMNRTSGDRKSQMAELIVDHDGRLHFDEAFLAYFPTLEREKAAIREISGSGSPGLLSTLATGDQTWDFVFFDSGELSSIIEWEILKDRIQIGGLAAFHDIYFPKSIKNFVVCASLLQDSNWKPIFMDESTTQGLLVAQRVQ
jgi:hypothetical protein